MAITTERLVVTSSDDCDETSGGTVETSDPDAYVSSQYWGAGFRFDNINIPQGTQIVSATFIAASTQTCSNPGNCNSTIWGDDANDTSTWGAGNKPSSITKTTANVGIAESGDYAPNSLYNLKKYDVTDIVQEILDRSGWVAGNAMSLVIEEFSTGRGNQMKFKTVDASSAYPDPKLEIVWKRRLTNVS